MLSDPSIISTGIPEFDHALGCGGLQRGRTVALHGLYGSGKTILALLVAGKCVQTCLSKGGVKRAVGYFLTIDDPTVILHKHLERFGINQTGNIIVEGSDKIPHGCSPLNYFQQRIEELTNDGCDVVVGVGDYILPYGCNRDQLQSMITWCNLVRSHNFVGITTHPFDRKLVSDAITHPTEDRIRHINHSHVVDQRAERECDVSVYMLLERSSGGTPYFNMRVAKNRYEPNCQELGTPFTIPFPEEYDLVDA